MVKVVIDGEGLLYSNWLPLTAGNSTGFVGFINTFRGIFRTKGITIIRPLLLKLPCFFEFLISLGLELPYEAPSLPCYWPLPPPEPCLGFLDLFQLACNVAKVRIKEVLGFRVLASRSF